MRSERNHRLNARRPVRRRAISADLANASALLRRSANFSVGLLLLTFSMSAREGTANEGHTIPRLVLRVASGPGQAARLVDFADEGVLLAVGAGVGRSGVPDEGLARGAGFVGAVSSRSKVKICGLRGPQVRQLFELGVDPAVILVGRPAAPA